MSKEVKKTCFIYARTSSDKNDDKVSCDLQVANCKQYAERNGYLVDGVFRDDDRHGWTYWECGLEEKFDDQVVKLAIQRAAKKRKYRGGLGELLSRIDEVDILLSNDPSRLMRVKLHSSLSQHLFNKLNENNTHLHFVDRGYFDHNNAQINSIFIFEQGMRQASKEEELKRGHDTLRRNREGGKKFRSVRCYGIDDAGKQKIKIIEAELNIVNRIFRLFVDENISRGKIASKFNEEGLDTIKGGSWSWDTINGILKNPRYIGKILRYSSYDVIEVERNELIDTELFEPVKQYLEQKFQFTEALFEKASKKIKSQAVDRSSHKSNKNPLPKKLKCGSCGRFLRINHYNRPNQKNSLYFCGSNKYSSPKKTSSCLGSTIAVNESFNLVKRSGLIEALKPICLIRMFEEFINTLAEPDRKKNLSALQKSKEALELRFEKVLDDIEDAKLGSLRKEKFKNRADQIEKEIREKEGAISELSKKINFNIKSLTFKDFANYLGNDVKFLEIINDTIDEIIVFQERIDVSLKLGQQVSIPRYQYENSWYMPFPLFEIKNLRYKGTALKKLMRELYNTENLVGFMYELDALKLPTHGLEIKILYSYPRAQNNVTGEEVYPWGPHLKPKDFERRKEVYNGKGIKIITYDEGYEKISYKGKKYNIYQFAKEFKIPLKTVQWRLKKGWKIQKIVETPIRTLPHRRLSEKEVEEIKDLCEKSSMLINDIAKKYGVCRDTISRIKNKHAHKE